MGPLALLNHVLNFVAPALFVALGVTLAARSFIRKKSAAPALSRQLAVNFAAAVLLLALGLWWFGHDGKIATYAGMTLLCASSQWFMLRGWKA